MKVIAGVSAGVLGAVVACVIGVVLLVAGMMPGSSTTTGVAPGEWVNPLPSAPIGWTFGWHGPYTFHRGQDLPAPCGTPYMAAAAGLVIEADMIQTSSGPMGRIRIDHGGGIVTEYEHSTMAGTLVTLGQHVQAGQTIALVGATGPATGCHLHYTVLIGGLSDKNLVDPVPFMIEHGAPLGNTK